MPNSNVSTEVVSHRPSLLDLADRRFDLVEGTLVPRAPKTAEGGKTPAEAVQASVAPPSSVKESAA